MSNPTFWFVIVVVALVACAVILLLLRRSRAAQEPRPRRALSGEAPRSEVSPAPEPARQAGVPLAAPPTPTGAPDASTPAAAPPDLPALALQGPPLHREHLIERDRVLDTSRWDNRPDGTEESDGGAVSGGPGVDASFIQALRERGQA
ncbi:hypothetical protein [Propioniciclava flava]|uniref:Uncharacterized protein n=1 Tax=Propioniciclava flava TaxID=2072026 RepID=A0A4Q2EHT6_9ACTN|nr:hypothetical protein [Propioniciclava flava]RXW32643.1 hypothetical protein C1706_05710 [Propioniciclava flava]